MDFTYKDYLAKMQDEELIAELEYYSELQEQMIEGITKLLEERNKELE